MKRFTLEDRIKIEELIKERLTTRQIAEAMKRNLFGVRTEITRYGGRGAYNGKQAHEQCLNSRIVGYEKVRAWHVEHNPKIVTGEIKREKKASLSERLDIVEKQIELLHKILRAKNGKGERG